eukprot:TRINITY_DN62659_c0_g1_i1.p1 TRINITY_DN62659_c0_g1~~TRINITY_DN62659_c0_g1_i1.p1  ORF type:complete len:403 (-),score=111.41 TRINITY_DN62659_c0_g1_i1:248-1456(-)
MSIDFMTAIGSPMDLDGFEDLKFSHETDSPKSAVSLNSVAKRLDFGCVEMETPPNHRGGSDTVDSPFLSPIRSPGVGMVSPSPLNQKYNEPVNDMMELEVPPLQVSESPRYLRSNQRGPISDLPPTPEVSDNEDEMDLDLPPLGGVGVSFSPDFASRQKQRRPFAFGSMSHDGPMKLRTFRSHSLSESCSDFKRSFQPEVEEPPTPTSDGPTLLPTCRMSIHPDLKCIDGDTLEKLMDGGFEGVKSYIIIDCRYEFEYQAGHIRGARNATDPVGLQEILFDDPPSIAEGKHIVVLFHCEYSQKRAPKLMRELRAMDRLTNQYPNLCYPEAYLIKDGYRSIFQTHQQLCHGSYRSMFDDDFHRECSSSRSLSKKRWDKHKQRTNSRRKSNRLSRSDSWYIPRS